MLVYFAMIFAVVGMCSEVVDHYDRRDNEKVYRLTSRIGNWGGAVLYFTAIAVDIAMLRGLILR